MHLLLLLVLMAAAEEQTPYHELVHGAFDAYQAGNYAKMKSLLDQFEKRGRPFDPAREDDACDPQQEYARLKHQADCLVHAQLAQKFWPSLDVAQKEVLAALRANKLATLAPYVACNALNLNREVRCDLDGVERIAAGELAAVNEKALKNPAALAAAKWELATLGAKEWKETRRLKAKDDELIGVSRRADGKVYLSEAGVPLPPQASQPDPNEGIILER